jgi:hypothetical protein
MCLETSCFPSYSVFLSSLILAYIYVHLTRDFVLTLHRAQLELQRRYSYTLHIAQLGLQCRYSYTLHIAQLGLQCRYSYTLHRERSRSCNVLILDTLHIVQLVLQCLIHITKSAIRVAKTGKCKSPQATQV